MTEGTVATRLGDLHVRRSGAGSPIVLWHSLYVDGRSMLPVAEALAKDHAVVVPDGWGHGRTPRVGRPWTIDDCADAALDLLDALEMPVVDWVGNAWGGHIGMALARRAPGRVRSLVAMCAPLQPVTGKERVRARLLVALYGWFGPIETVFRPLQAALVLPRNEEAAAYVREVFLAQDRAGMVEAMRYAMLGRGSAEGPIPVPTLLVTTGENALSTPEVVRAQAAVAGAQVAVLSGCRHLPPIETPEPVVALVRAWLANPGREPSF